MPSIGAYYRDAQLRVRAAAKRHFSYRSRLVSRFLLGGDSEKPTFGLDKLDLRLQDQIDLSPQYYIEVGANDGVAQSNTLGLEILYGWTGLLIEPAAATFAQLKRNRSRRRNRLIRAACVSFSFNQPEVQLIFSNLMSVAIGLDSSISNPYAHAKKGERFLSDPQSSGVESVPAVTLTRALEDAGAPREIGLLSLDVEGAELEVLKGIDFGRYRIRWILVEARNLRQIRSYLEMFGYELQSQLSHHDYLFREATVAR